MINNKFKFILFLLFVPFFVFHKSAAQTEKFSFTSLAFSTFDYKENSISSITQDSLGFIYYATRNGLFKYDGITQQKVDYVDTYLDSISEKDISNILFDHEGRLWVLSLNHIFVFNFITESLVHIPKVTDTYYGRLNSIFNTPSGEMLISTRTSAFSYDFKTNVLSPFVLKDSNRVKVSFPIINEFYQFDEQFLWLATRNGLYKTKKSGDSYTVVHRYLEGNSNSNSITNNNVQCLVTNNEGNLWIGTSSGLNYLDVTSGKVTRFTQNGKKQIANNYIRDLTFDNKGRLWVGTFDGITVIDTLGNHLTIKEKANTNFLFNDNRIRTIFKDKMGNMWIGTYFGGISYWSSEKYPFLHFDLKRELNYSNTVVNSILQSDDGIIYFGIEGGGISMFDPNANTFIGMLSPNRKINNVKSLCQSGSSLFIGTFGNGLISYNRIQNSYKEHPLFLTHLTEVNHTVLDIIELPANKLAIATLNRGLIVYDLITKSVTDLVFDRTIPYTIPNNTVRSLLLDKNNTLWVGTVNGLCRIEADSIVQGGTRFSRITKRSKLGANVSINDICEDENGKIWLATEFDGLLRVENNELVSENLFGIKTISSILNNNKTDLWLGTNKGIVKYNSETKVHEVYNEKDGVVPNEFNRNSGIITNKGDIFLGGVSGVTMFNPKDLEHQKRNNHKVILTDLLVFNKLVRVHDRSKILNQAIAYAKSIQLQHNQNIFTLRFSSANYSNVRIPQFEYRLLGLNEEWIKTSENSVTYSIQETGNYVFEIRNVVESGVGSENVTRLTIEIIPPLWRTWWAYSLYSLLFMLLLVVVIVFIRSKTILKHKLKLEMAEHLQQKEINELKLRFFTHISHDFKTPLTLIVGLLQQVISEFKGNVDLFKKLLLMKKNSDQLFKLINELMDFRKLEKSQMKLSVRENNMVAFVKDVYDSFMPKAEFQKYEYSFYAEKETITAWFDLDKFERVIFNILSNAFKFTEYGGKIEYVFLKKMTQLIFP